MNELMLVFKEKWSVFVEQNKRWLGPSVACFAGFLVLVIYFQTSPSPELYAKAEGAVSKWLSSNDEQSYAEMRQALRRVPSLEKKYEPIIAQELFRTHQLSDALVLAGRSIASMKEDAPFHAIYGETTLLIEQGLFQDALEKSVSLKEFMLKDCDLESKTGKSPVGGVLLYVHNLLRIASLQKELHNRPGERAAWDEVEQFLQKGEDLSRFVLGQFQDEGLDLSHYIAERKKQL